MFSYAKSKGMDWGTLDTLPDVVGLALHKDGHVGYTVGGGYAVEWQGFSSGCVKTKIAGRGWTSWFKLPFIDYNDGSSHEENPTLDVPLGSRLLKKGTTGTDVKALQELLMQLGYSLSKYGVDGAFGSETEAAPAPDTPMHVGQRVMIVSEGGKVNIRVGNGTQYARLSSVAPGTTFEHIATAANGWHAVPFGNRVGWVSERYSHLY